ncbi:38681_t:CDS:2, partial [Gigaspora margarita]
GILRLRDAQLLLRSTVPIWALNNDEIKKLKWRNNLNASILATAKDMEIRNLLNNKDLEKDTQGSWDRNERKMPQWFQKLKQTVLENKITRSIKEVFKQEANKENLSLNSPSETSIVPISKTLKAKVNEVEDSQTPQKPDSFRKKIRRKERNQNGTCSTHRKLKHISDPKYNTDIKEKPRNLYTSLTSEKKADKYRKRNYMARGLIESDLATSLLAMGITRKVADLIITKWWNKWHKEFLASKINEVLDSVGVEYFSAIV